MDAQLQGPVKQVDWLSGGRSGSPLRAGTQGLTSPILSRSQRKLGTSCAASANVLLPCSVSFLTEHVVCVPGPSKSNSQEGQFLFFFKNEVCVSTGFPGGSMVKNLPANAGDTGSIHGSGRMEMAIHSSIHAWEIPWTEEPGGPQSMGSQNDLVTK